MALSTDTRSTLRPQHLVRPKCLASLVLAVGVVGAIVAALGNASPVRHYNGDRHDLGYGMNSPFLCRSDGPFDDTITQVTTGLVLERKTGCEQPDPASTPALASQLTMVPQGSEPPDGTTWQMVDAGACNRTFPEEISFERPTSLAYTGETDADLLRDAQQHGAKWRMAAVATDRTIVAISEWCSAPVTASTPPDPLKLAARSLTLCGCETHLELIDGLR